MNVVTRCLAFAAILSCPLILLAEAPIKVSEIVPADVLIAEAEKKAAELEELLSDEKAYEELDKNGKKKIAQASGTLACLAQAILEHPDGDKSKIAAAAARDAALTLRKPGSFAESRSAMVSIQAAMQGRGDGKKDHEWNHLINMHRMMEEFNARNSKIRRVLRRPGKALEDSGHAATMAVLGIAMLSDTHEVKNEADVPEWQKMSKDFTLNMSALAKALREGDQDAAKELYTTGSKSCGACHKKFRD